MIWWVRAAGGSDGNSGADFANGYATIDKAYQSMEGSGVAGDSIYIVNDGTHTLPTSAVTPMTNVALGGTDYTTDPGFIVKGVDETGTEALATVQSAVSTSPGRFIYLRSGVSYVRIEGLFLDMSLANVGDGGSFALFRDADSGPIQWRACRFKGYADSDANYGDAARQVMGFGGTAPADFGEIRYCIIENCSKPTGWVTAGQKASIHHCVIWIKNIFATTFPNSWIYTATASSVNVLEFYNNTVYYDLADLVTAVADIVRAAPITGNYGTVNFHSNFMWLETTASASPAIDAIFGGSSGSTATNVGTLGYNVIQYGPSLASGDVGVVYEDPWEDGVDPKATDNVDHEVAAATLFLDPVSTFTWQGIDGTGYSLLVPADLRPLLYKTAGLAGVVPGALPAAETDYSVTAVGDLLNPEVEDNVQFTITLGNTGTDAANVEVSALLPAGLTYVSHSPTAGTYGAGTGTWSVPDLDTGTTETLVINAQVDADQTGNTIVFTASYTSGEPTTDTDSSNDSSSVTLQIVDEEDPGDESTAGAYLDVFPIYAELWRYAFNVSMRTKRNRIVSNNIRDDKEQQSMRELSLRRIIVAPATTETVNIGGIERGHTLMLEADSAVQLSVAIGSATDLFGPETTFVFIGGGDFETVKVKNNSATASATVTIGVTD